LETEDEIVEARNIEAFDAASAAANNGSGRPSAENVSGKPAGKKPGRPRKNTPAEDDLAATRAKSQCARRSPPSSIRNRVRRKRAEHEHPS